MDMTIKVLTGADRVRLRPAVIFGSDDAEGAQCALEMLLSVMVSECRKGYATRLSVTRFPDGSLMLEDNGRGIFLGSGSPQDDQIWKNKFCELYCGPAYPEPNREQEFSYFDDPELIPCDEYESEPYGDWDLCAVQYASVFMNVSVWRDGKLFSLSFEKGVNIGGLSVEPSDLPSGTAIRFRLDEAVFRKVDISDEYLITKLEQLAILCPGCEFYYRSGKDEKCFCFPQGIPSDTAVYTRQIAAVGKERYNRPQYGAKIQVSVGFVKEGARREIFHNYKSLPLGGPHVEAILERVADRLTWQLERRITPAMLESHLCLTVHTTTSKYTCLWDNGTRTRLNSTMITHMAQDCINDDFTYFVRCHRDEINAIFQPWDEN